MLRCSNADTGKYFPSTTVRPSSGAHQTSYSMGTGFFSGVKRPKRFVDHCPPYSAEVKNEWSYTSIPVLCLHDVDSHGFTFVYSDIYPTACNDTQFINFWKLLYMFRVVPPPIIRSTYYCFYSTWYLSTRNCYLPLSWWSWNFVPSPRETCRAVSRN